MDRHGWKAGGFLGLNNRGRIYWAVSGSGRADRQRRHVQSPHRLEAGKSYALAAVYDPGRRLAIYINGHLSVETAQDVPERVFDCDSPVMLGSRPGQTHADVVIGEVRLSPRALEEADIARWARELELTERPGERFLWERAVFAPDAASAPVRALTTGPKPHWFGYYDKFQTDPTDRYVLSLEADFDLRLPVVGDVARIGMIDTQDGNKWIPLAETGAWNWQQGCMLQWRPGSDREIIYNDREGERFVARILDVSTGRTRTLPRAVGHVSPDGKYALCEDFARMRAMRPVIGYAVADPTQYLKEAAPADSGVWLMDLETGESRIVVSMADVARIPYPNQTPAERLYCNHTQWSPDGKRFLFIARGDNINSRMMTANRDGSELRPLTHGASHFDWLDGQHILVEMRGGFFLFRDDGSMRGRNILAVPAGHQSYLPGHRWLVSDTIPMGPEREQHPYLVEFLSSPLSKGYRGDESDVRIVPLGHFHQPPEYSGDVRCDNHPRQSRDGRKIIIDSAHSGTRQMYMIDIAGIVGRLAAGGS
ncbi:hypothetical protein HS125_17635 [bacterium]|nr:hypothetical protein [bacterium]